MTIQEMRETKKRYEITSEVSLLFNNSTDHEELKGGMMDYCIALYNRALGRAILRLEEPFVAGSGQEIKIQAVNDLKIKEGE